jgi:hypothetical protein
MRRAGVILHSSFGSNRLEILMVLGSSQTLTTWPRLVEKIDYVLSRIALRVELRTRNCLRATLMLEFLLGTTDAGTLSPISKIQSIVNVCGSHIKPTMTHACAAALRLSPKLRLQRQASDDREGTDGAMVGAVCALFGF